ETDEGLRRRMRQADDERLFVVAEAFRRGMSVDVVHADTRIDRWFLRKIQGIVELEGKLSAFAGRPWDDELKALVREAKEKGFADQRLAQLLGMSLAELRRALRSEGIAPVYKIVDSCAAEYDAV